MIAYWEKADGERASYEIVVPKQAAKRKRGKDWAARIVAMKAIGEITMVLQPEGYRLKYKQEERDEKKEANNVAQATSEIGDHHEKKADR